MSPKRLTAEEKVTLFCYHLKRVDSGIGWVVDPDLGYSVCSECRKPSPMAGLRICAECGDEFVVNPGDKRLSRFAVLSSGIVIEQDLFCPKCNCDE